MKGNKGHAPENHILLMISFQYLPLHSTPKCDKAEINVPFCAFVIFLHTLVLPKINDKY